MSLDCVKIRCVPFKDEIGANQGILCLLIEKQAVFKDNYGADIYIQAQPGAG
jgi:hypothetical protein